jgi:preprotein translocase subunit SecG
MAGIVPYLNVVQILLAIVLIAVVLLQSKGSAFSGAFSTDASVFSTRRGLEKTLFQATLVLAGVFIVVSIVSSTIAARSGA